MTSTLCLPTACDLKDACLRYASPEVVERGQAHDYTDFSHAVLPDERCPWFFDRDNKEQQWAKS